MTNTASDRVRWTTAGLELFPDSGNRYEIIDEELLVTRAPHWNHQKIGYRYLWSEYKSSFYLLFDRGSLDEKFGLIDS